MSLEQMEALYRERHEKMVRWAWSLLGNKQDAEDAVQEAFLRWLERGAIDVPKAWVEMVLRSRVVDGIRTRRLHDRYVSDVEVSGAADWVEAPDSLQPVEDRMLAEATLARLPEQHRVSVILKAEGMRSCQAAGVLGISTSKVKRLWMEATQIATGEKGHLGLDEAAKRDDLRNRIRAMRREGMACNRIAVILNKEGIKGERGGRWGAQTVRNMLMAQ